MKRQKKNTGKQSPDATPLATPEDLRRWRADMIRIDPAVEALEGRKVRPRLDDEREAPIPKWEELQSRGSITQDYAARLLRCSKKTVGRLADRRELKRSDAGRIVCDEQFRHQMRKKHGQHILR